jgi:hypothetical protein
VREKSNKCKRLELKVNEVKGEIEFPYYENYFYE